MLLKAVGFITTVGAGFGLSLTKLRINLRTAIVTGLLAAIAQASLKLALPHDSIEEFAQAHMYTVPGQIVLMVLALLETAGLVIPVALMPWTNPSSRAWAALYVLGGALVAAATHYFPFDVEMVNGKVIGPRHARLSVRRT